MTPRYTDPLQDRLRRDLGRQVRDDVWRRLAAIGLVAKVRDNPGEYTRLLEEYEDLDEAFPAKTSTRRLQNRERTTPPDTRLEGMSRLLAERAARDAAVQAFRRDILHDRLVEWTELDSWVSSRAPQPDDPTLTIVTQRHCVAHEGPLSTAFAPEWDVALSQPDPVRLPGVSEWETEALTLEYVRDGGTMGRVQVPASGPLLDLYLVVRHLTLDGLFAPSPLTEAGPAWAVSWILCGVTPHLPRILVSFQGDLSMPSLARVTVSANWRASAEEVSREYNWARGAYPGRDKPMKDRSLALAILADRWRDEDGSWPVRRDEWNAACDGLQQPRAWRFTVKQDPYANAFANQARASWRRLTGGTWGGSR